jgi:TatD DNase family protein
MDFFDFHHQKIHQRRNLQFGYWGNSAGFPYSIGIHPNDIDIRHNIRVDWMKTTMFENCFAIGECGLDSWFY